MSLFTRVSLFDDVSGTGLIPTPGSGDVRGLTTGDTVVSDLKKMGAMTERRITVSAPMKAPSDTVSASDLMTYMKMPCLVSYKLDGFLCLVTSDGPRTSALKPIGNKFVREYLSDPKYIGLQGELVVGCPHRDAADPDDDVYNRTTGALRRASGEPDFTFHVFDDFSQKEKSYNDRWINGRAMNVEAWGDRRVRCLPQVLCYTLGDVLQFEQRAIDLGYEGAMVRSPTAPYRDGKLTLRAGIILKRKPVAQAEGVIIDVYEQMENCNEAFTDERGFTKRSSHQENKVGKSTLGGFEVRCPQWPAAFRCGTFIGGTKEWRQQVWDNRDQYIGKYLTFVYQAYGSIDGPRQPRGKIELRDPDDMTSDNPVLVLGGV